METKFFVADGKSATLNFKSSAVPSSTVKSPNTSNLGTGTYNLEFGSGMRGEGEAVNKRAVLGG